MVSKPLLRILTQNSLCQGGWQCHRTFGESEGEWSLPWGLSGQGCTCNAGKADSIPGSGRSLEKEMATHCSILAWEIPWTQEPGGL